MKELENIKSQMEKEMKKREQAENRIKLLKQKEKQVKRSKETQRKIRKGGVFEAFEREITGMQEETNNDLIYAFLDYVLSNNKNREKLKELTDIHLKEQGIDVEELKKLYDENDSLEDVKTENTNEEM